MNSNKMPGILVYREGADRMMRWLLLLSVASTLALCAGCGGSLDGHDYDNTSGNGDSLPAKGATIIPVDCGGGITCR